MQPIPGRPGRSPAAGAVAVIAALRSEIRTLDRTPSDAGEFVTYQSGPGAAAAAAAAARAIGEGATGLVSWGLAGGLSAAAVTGAVLLPVRIVSANAAPIAADPEWRSLIAALLQARFDLLDGDLAATASVLSAPAAKARVAAALGAVAVDMESRAIAEVASRSAVPFVAVRIVADGPDDSLPEGVETFVDAAGDVRAGRALGAILRRPQLLLPLIALGRKSARAHATLARVGGMLGSAGFLAHGVSAGATA